MQEIGFTRMRGGDPPCGYLPSRTMSVLPACAGVILEEAAPYLRSQGFTRMRGGDPTKLKNANMVIKFYPHARG